MARVYFRGTDDTLWVLFDDGTDRHPVGNFKTQSTPFVIPGPEGGSNRVYFQELDNTL
jgi:hypothetical protein